MAIQHATVRFGAAYYFEYAGPGEDPRPETLERDLDLMRDAGFSVIRVGESVWSTWEPSDGRFELDWLEPVLDGAHARGIDVVLGTPTYAVPMWLVRRYPELAGELRTGQAMGWGARQEVDYTHSAFRFHGERVLQRIVERYRDHPAVVGYQVDNEPGLHLLHNRGVFEKFSDYLRDLYGDVETLNREWGLTYWSHKLSDWADLWTPDGNAQPQYDLAWRRFQALLTTEMIAWQAQAVRKLARPGQWVTTCLAYDRPALDDADVAAQLDIISGNAYYQMQGGLAHPSATHAPQYGTSTGTWSLFRAGDTMFSSLGEPFLVTETNAQTIGGPSENYPAYPGQWRQAAWALVSRGARMVEYWNWHTLHYGAETYWGGVLPHSGVPGRTYREIASLGAEFARAGEAIAHAMPDADIAVLSSTDSAFALSAQPPLESACGTGDPTSYHRIVGAFYRGAFDAGLQVRIVRPRQVFTEQPADVVRVHPVLVAAGYYAASDADLDWFLRYVRAGGHLVVGPRTGYADHEARARAEVQPAGIAEAAGAWYDEFSNLTEPVLVTGVLAGEATEWAECLVAEGADVLARYEHPHFGTWSAVTTKQHEGGRITVVGTVPGRDLARSLAAWLVPIPLCGWVDLPASVTVHTSTRPDGARVHVVHNWAWENAVVRVPVELDIIVAPRGDRQAVPQSVKASGTRLATGSTVTLGSWDVLVAVTS